MNIVEYQSAQTYEDLLSGKFCINCNHLISDHFVFKSTNEAKCYFCESKDGTFTACDCRKISTDFKFVFKPEELAYVAA